MWKSPSPHDDTDRPVLYYDIENEPTSFRERYPLTKPIAIGWQKVDGGTDYWAKGEGESLASGLERFRNEFWNIDSIAAGHNIRDHDNPIINGAMLRLGLEPLTPKKCRDTLRDLTSLKGIGRSLEALTIYLGLGDRKHHLSEAEWEDLWSMDTQDKRDTVIDRCLSDVALNVEVGKRLAGFLHAPKMWNP